MSSSETFKTPVPANLLPECWNQDERMKSLYAPFRNRAVNPEDWNSKYKFWNQFIKTWSNYYACCSFTLTDLNTNFKRNGCSALCLSTVLQELYRNGEVILESDFLKEPSNSWAGWTVDMLVRKPISWSFSKLVNYMTEPVIDPGTKYVHLATVKELAEVVLSTIDNKKENTLQPLSELLKNCREKSGNNKITENNLKLALIWLRNTKRATFRDCQDDDKNEMLVKIAHKNVEQITDIDEGIHKLHQQELMLIKNVEQLERERNEVIEKAKSSLAGGLKQVAKSFLRKKHELDKCLEKRSNALHNVQRLLVRINDARYDTDTLAAYKAGCNALKKFEDTGLTEDNVVDTMDNMAEVLDELKEVQSVMAQPISTTSESDSELEKELADILALDDNNDFEKSFDKTFDSAQLPNLSALGLQDVSLPKNTFTKELHPSQT
ncbi:charged multivesicular body protein 7 [Copidosoma floridanum]|uniref:charged multivesicular body protein 7 n=1 Tax=Copidosoma floridanum TaxID=29053 RepID=UPI0006C9C398|nr:charged multivesicular body protein 7 [Copidosoma floridanum]